MRLACLALIAACNCWSQISVVFKPISLLATRRIVGRERTVGWWTVSACNDGLATRSVARERLTALAPELHELPNVLAEDVIGRQNAADPKSFIGANGDAILQLASSGTAIGGYLTGSGPAQIVGLSLTGLQFIFRTLAKGAPDARPYYSTLLPDEFSLDAGRCRTFGLISGLIPNARTFSGVVQ